MNHGHRDDLSSSLRQRDFAVARSATGLDTNRTGNCFHITEVTQKESVMNDPNPTPTPADQQPQPAPPLPAEVPPAQPKPDEEPKPAETPPKP